MGAAAISVLAGARIVEMASAPMVNATRGLVAGTSVLFWSFRHLAHPTAGGGRVVAAPDTPGAVAVTTPLLWSLVFPSACMPWPGIYLGQADHLPIVGAVGFGELWVALGVWVLVFAAMARHVWRTVVVGPSEPPQELLRD